MSGPPPYFGDPPPRNTPFSEDEVSRASDELLKAAFFATQPGQSGERFVPGLSVAMVFGQNGHFSNMALGSGVNDVRGSEQPGVNTLFPCASLSKPVAASLLTLAPKWDGNWDREVPGPDGHNYRIDAFQKAITPRDWLSHTSGLPDHAGDLIEDLHPPSSMSRDDIIRKIVKFQTGSPTPHAYTNFGFTMGCLGALRAFSGEDWESFSKAALEEIGMTASTYAFTSAFDADPRERVLPHKGKPMDEGDPRGWQWHVVDRKDERNPSRQAPAGGLISSATDMTKFLEARLSGRFGDFPPTPRDPDWQYSLGWNVADHSGKPGFEKALNKTSYSHSGAFMLGAGTCVRVDPGVGIGVAVLTNGEPTGVAESLVRIFFNRLYGQPGEDEFKTNGQLDYGKVIATLRAAMLQQLNATKNENIRKYPRDVRRPIPSTVPEGVFFMGHSDYYGCDITIERKREEAWLTIGEWRFPLRCFDGHPDAPIFVYDTIGENEVGPSPLFLKVADAKFRTLVDEWLNQEPPSGVGVIQNRRA